MDANGNYQSRLTKKNKYDKNFSNWGRTSCDFNTGLWKFNTIKPGIVQLNKSEILKNIEKLKKDLFNLRFQKVNGQVKSTSKINETKKTIARMKTMLERNINA